MQGRGPNSFRCASSEIHTIPYNEACNTGGEGICCTSFSNQGKRLDNLVWKHSVVSLPP